MIASYTKNLDHLGLVAGFCDSIGLANIIDKAIGGTTEREVSYGKLVVAMVLNGLGFTGHTLHMYSEYFKDKLLGEGIEAEHINDDALGRTLDALFECGVSELYQQIGEAVVAYLGLKIRSLHLDSTSFHYDGQETEEEEPKHIRITKE